MNSKATVIIWGNDDSELYETTVAVVISEILEDLMQRQQITIFLVKEGVEIHKDSKSQEKFMFGMKALMAKNFIDNLSEETRKGLLEKAETGMYPGLAPYGYKNVQDPNDSKRRIVIIAPAVAPIIRDLFNQYATGRYSIQQLRDEAHWRGVRSRTGKKLHKSRIEKMLKDPFYCGDFIWAGKRCKGKHAGIISSDLFERVQATFSSKFRSKGIKNNRPFRIWEFSRAGIVAARLRVKSNSKKRINRFTTTAPTTMRLASKAVSFTDRKCWTRSFLN